MPINVSIRFSSKTLGLRDVESFILLIRSSGKLLIIKSLNFLTLERATNVRPSDCSDFPKSITTFSSVCPWDLLYYIC